MWRSIYDHIGENQFARAPLIPLPLSPRARKTIRTRPHFSRVRPLFYLTRKQALHASEQDLLRRRLSGGAKAPGLLNFEASF